MPADRAALLAIVSLMSGRSKGFADRGVVPWATRRCLLLTTYRGDGTTVATPVWFVTDAPEIKLWTAARSAKVSRLRRDPRCTVAACTYFGRPTSEAIPGRARILDGTDGTRVQTLLRAKYPIQKRALDVYAWLRRRGRPEPAGRSVHLAITVSP
jgi:uncharacterized protein